MFKFTCTLIAICTLTLSTVVLVGIAVIYVLGLVASLVVGTGGLLLTTLVSLALSFVPALAAVFACSYLFRQSHCSLSILGMATIVVFLSALLNGGLDLAIGILGS